MFNTSRSEQDAWNACVKTILGLLGTLARFFFLHVQDELPIKKTNST